MTKHNATYTAALLPIFANLLPKQGRLLDAFAGVGKIALLRAWLPELTFYGCEIEPEWATAANAAGCHTPLSSTLHLPYAAGTFDAICTSPTYGNRMADHHEARDNSPRHTYRHTIGHPLHPENSGAMQWGPEYRAFHAAAWAECLRVLKPGGVFVLNIKDHIRAGQIIPVTAWHVDTLLALGFKFAYFAHVPCPGQRHGAHGDLRITWESVYQLLAPSA